MRIILASSSIYRKQLLKRLQLPFEVCSPQVDETALANEAPAALAQRLAIKKALAISKHHPNSLVIGSDQVASLGQNCLGKPGNHANAIKQLQQLQGQKVIFHTAVCVALNTQYQVDNIPTTCHFRPLSDTEIENYLRLEQPYDTAGSAKAESLGISLMQSMQSGDPTAIIGLPLISLSQMLRTHGINPLISL